MGTSDSKMEEALDVARSKRINADKLSLAALRSQFTNSSNPSVDQAELTSARSVSYTHLTLPTKA